MLCWAAAAWASPWIAVSGDSCGRINVVWCTRRMPHASHQGLLPVAGTKGGIWETAAEARRLKEATSDCHDVASHSLFPHLLLAFLLPLQTRLTGTL